MPSSFKKGRGVCVFRDGTWWAWALCGASHLASIGGHLTGRYECRYIRLNINE